MLKFPFIVALGVTLACPAAAMDTATPDTVTLEQWSATVEKSLDEHLRYPAFTRGTYKAWSR